MEEKKNNKTAFDETTLKNRKLKSRIFLGPCTHTPSKIDCVILFVSLNENRRSSIPFRGWSFEGKRKRRHAQGPSPRRGRGAVQRPARQFAQGQGIAPFPRPLSHHRPFNAHPRRRIAQPPRQEVLCVLVTRQVQHPRHPRQAVTLPAHHHSSP